MFDSVWRFAVLIHIFATLSSSKDANDNSTDGWGKIFDPNNNPCPAARLEWCVLDGRGDLQIKTCKKYYLEDFELSACQELRQVLSGNRFDISFPMKCTFHENKICAPENSITYKGPYDKYKWQYNEIKSVNCSVDAKDCST
jgi:hypothetical protein